MRNKRMHSAESVAMAGAFKPKATDVFIVSTKVNLGLVDCARVGAVGTQATLKPIRFTTCLRSSFVLRIRSVSEIKSNCIFLHGENRIDRVCVDNNVDNRRAVDLPEVWHHLDAADCPWAPERGIDGFWRDL
jgi:hypothetical protein